MDLRTLRYFCTLVREGHFGRAALKLRIAQPPLTRAIQKLERDLGVLLLHRRRRSFDITPAGIMLYERAVRLLDGADQAWVDVRRADAGEMGQLVLGFVHSTAFTILPEIAAKFRASYPDVRLSVREMHHNDLLLALESGTVDVGLLRPPISNRTLQVQPLIHEPFLVLVPAAHRLIRGRSISLRRLEQEPFVLFSRAGSPLIHSRVVAMCEAAGFTPQPIQFADQIHTVAGFVAAGLGVAIAPSTVRSFNFSGLRLLQIQEKVDPLPMAIVTRLDNRSALVSNLVALARSAAAAWQAEVRKG